MKNKKPIFAIAVLCMIYLASFIFIYNVSAVPEGASVSWISNSTKASETVGSRADTKGSINTILLSTTQQNIRWKAYVGNVSGILVLNDAQGYSIYQWPALASPTGEVYMTRNNSLDWDTIQCANESDVQEEQSKLGHTATASDNINNTFASAIHNDFVVGTTNISNSTCMSVVTWINNTAQTQTESSLFQEVLLMDANLRIIYTTVINQDTSSYRNDTVNNTNGTSYDFQALLPDFGTASTATYYFYVEIDG